MSVKINLKSRPSDGIIMADLVTVRQFYSLPTLNQTKEALYNFFSPISGFVEKVHDRQWLKKIIDFVPVTETGQQKLTTLTALAPWMKLAMLVGDLTDESLDVVLLDDQASLIWERLCSPDFRVDRVSLPFAQFLFDLSEILAKKFPGVE